MEYRYTAVVLGKKETGETDRLYTLYTEEAGKMSVMAKGVRKPVAKLAAQLENGTLLGVTVIRGRGIGKIAGAIAEERFTALREDHEILHSLLRTLERVRLLTEPDESDPVIFSLLTSFLELGDQAVKQAKREQFLFLRECFLLKLYSALGYHINTTRCLETGEKLIAGQRYVFSPKDGACILFEQGRKYPDALFVSEKTIKLLRLILNNTLESLLKIRNAEEETKNIARVGEGLYRWTIRH